MFISHKACESTLQFTEKRQWKEIMADMWYLAITKQTRPNQISMRQMHKACIYPNVNRSLPLSLDCFPFFLSCQSLQLQRTRKLRSGHPVREVAGE